jgi:hypothetical protein
MFANHRILWYDSSRCERDPLQSKTQEIDIDKYIERIKK